MAGLIVKKGDWYCFRAVSTSSKRGLKTTPALVLINATDGEAWSVVVARTVYYASSPVGESTFSIYALAWLKAGENEYSPAPFKLADLFHDEIRVFEVELSLQGILDRSDE